MTYKRILRTEPWSLASKFMSCALYLVAWTKVNKMSNRFLGSCDPNFKLSIFNPRVEILVDFGYLQITRLHFVMEYGIQWFVTLALIFNLIFNPIVNKRGSINMLGMSIDCEKHVCKGLEYCKKYFKILFYTFFIVPDKN